MGYEMNNATKEVLCERCGAVTRRFYYGANGDVCWTDMMHKCPLLGRTHREGQEVDEMVARATDSGITLSREEAKLLRDPPLALLPPIDEGAEALERAIEKNAARQAREKAIEKAIEKEKEKEVQQGRITVHSVCKTCGWQCTTRRFRFAAGCMCMNGCGNMTEFASFHVSSKLLREQEKFDTAMKRIFSSEGKRSASFDGVETYTYDISLGDRSIKAPLGTKIADIPSGVTGVIESGEGVYTINRPVEPTAKCAECNGRGYVEYRHLGGYLQLAPCSGCGPHSFSSTLKSEQTAESHGPPLETPDEQDDAKTIPKISIPAPSAPARQYTREDGSIDWERYTGRAR